MVKLEIGEIKSNQLVRPACSQVASARPKFKQSGKDTSEPRETRGIIVHKAIICPALGYDQAVQLLFGQLMRDLWIWRTASGMHDVQAKAIKIFQESNTTLSHLLPQFQHERSVLRKGQIGIRIKHGHHSKVHIAKTIAIQDLIHFIFIFWIPWFGPWISRRASSLEEIVPT